MKKPKKKSMIKNSQPPPDQQKVIKGYKVFNPDFTCNGMQYAEKNKFDHKGPLQICSSGLHFCLKAQDCFNYYAFDPNNIVCEVEAIGSVIYHEEDSKACTDILIIGRKLDWHEVLAVANSGSNNTGHSNSGDRNSGDRNSGYRNSGDWNSGDRNSGDSNSGYRNSGAFCTDTNPILYLFNRPTKMTIKEWENHPAISILNALNPTIWIPESIMTEEEKKSNPKWETTEGYLKTISIKEAWVNLWHNLTDKNKKILLALPNFDASVFEEITGIKI